MRVGQPITDYIQKSILTDEGDIVVRGALNPQRVGVSLVGRVLSVQSGSPKVFWANMFNTISKTGDLLIRGSVAPERKAAGALGTYFKGTGLETMPMYEKVHLADTGIYVGNGSRDTTGDEQITGVGFLPSAVIFAAVDDDANNQNWSVGFDDADNHMCLWNYATGTATNIILIKAIRIYRTSSHYMNGSIEVLSSDGFRMNWTLVGTCPIQYVFMCLP